jgi:hypothetical protein
MTFQVQTNFFTWWSGHYFCKYIISPIYLPDFIKTIFFISRSCLHGLQVQPVNKAQVINEQSATERKPLNQANG